MVIYSKITLDGNEIFPEQIKVTKTLGDINSSSTFNVNINNYSGRYTGSYSIGDVVEVYSDKDVIVPIAHYKMNDNAATTVVIDSEGNYNGTCLVNTNTISDVGKINTSLNFDAANKEITTPVIKLNQKPFSVFAWIYKASIVSTNSIWDIGFDFGNNLGYLWRILGTNLLQILVGTTTFSSITPINENEWTHIGVVHDGTNLTFYLNGNSDGTHLSSLSANSVKTINVIASDDTVDNWFNGSIDDLRIYNTAITEAEILKIYNEGDGTEKVRTKIFLGILENIDLKGKKESESIILSGRDYSARMMDRTVEPETYNNLPAGSIVKDIIAKYTDDITTNNVSDGVNVERIVFNHTPVFDAVKELSNFADYMFYIDNNKDLHFKEKSTTESGYTFGSGGTPVIKSSFKEKRDQIYNEVWVYGDRYLDAYQEQFNADGTGSVFPLLYSPHNTEVTLGSGITVTEKIQPGGIFEMTFEAGSQYKYLVSYDDKKIIFTSGTDAGNNIPTIGSQVTINYMRDLPIVKFGDNDSSINAYGKRVKVIQDTTIKDPITAQTILLNELDEWSDPLKQGTLIINSVGNIDPGETCVVNIPHHDIDNMTYDILQATYNLTKREMLADNVVTIKVNKRIPDITDTLKDLLLQQRRLQSKDLQSTDLLTRYKFNTGSFGIRTSGINIWTMSVGSSFVLGNPTTGRLGSYSTHSLGRWGTGSSLIWSGGYF